MSADEQPAPGTAVSAGDTLTSTDLPLHAFPFTIELKDEDTGETLWSAQIAGPGSLEIPGFSPRHVSATIIHGTHRITTFSDGSSEEADD